MAGAAVSAVVNVLHGNVCASRLHQKELRMTFFAAVQLCMPYMIEARRHGGLIECYIFNAVAITAHVFINAYVLMTLKLVTLVTVKAGDNMQPVREHSLCRPRREFIKRVAPETWESSYGLIS
jgi:hypothetical protein